MSNTPGFAGSAGVTSLASGTVVEMGGSAAACEMGEVVGRSTIDESRGAEGVAQPTPAEAAADIGVLVGHTQSGGEQAEVPVVVSRSGRTSKKKQKVSM